jgi:hypothetical protein
MVAKLASDLLAEQRAEEIAKLQEMVRQLFRNMSTYKRIRGVPH